MNASRGTLLRRIGRWTVCVAEVAAFQACIVSDSLAQDDAPSEAARRQALAPFRFILRHAEQEQKPKDNRKPKPAPAAEAKADIARPPASAASSPELAALPPPAPAAPAEAAVTHVVALAPAPKPLVPIRQDPPVLTAAMQRDAGSVTVAFDVRPDGSTGDVRVVKTTNRRFNSPVVTAISNWRFQAIDDTRSVEVDFVFGEQ